MSKTIFFNFKTDKAKKEIKIERSFNAPRELVWAAWTEPQILDQWWAPKPWKTETQQMHFKVGGFWHYAMVGPEGDKHHGRIDYTAIKKLHFITGYDGFCDENGQTNYDLPVNNWETKFSDQGESTMVYMLLTFKTLDDLEKIIEMGFKEGFTSALENLDQYLAAGFQLRGQNKSDNKARVSTYVNFPGNTETAFNFYKSVFKTEFVNGIQRFGDIPQDPAQAPIADTVKKMVLHVELPLTGGHILMGTDAPEEMGFTVTQGNNMHINIEPESKEEADKIFNALAVDGNITMPLQDMFWGAYFGSLTDQFGINWMINFQK
jgi:uncharacterized glyoxalase superfamily protein PhnB/uncharacterized protein YndB with AHSA1/START domain